MSVGLAFCTQASNASVKYDLEGKHAGLDEPHKTTAEGFVSHCDTFRNSHPDFRSDPGIGEGVIS
jgi:hypothetical protein